MAATTLTTIRAHIRQATRELREAMHALDNNDYHEASSRAERAQMESFEAKSAIRRRAEGR